MATISLRPQQAAKLVSKYIDARIPVLLTGAPGVGKSSIVEQAPVISRFGAVVGVETSLDDWCEWALGANMPPELISFLRFRPDLLHVQDTRKADDMENFPCPRTWEYVGKAIHMRLPDDLEFAAFAGAVGEGAAVEFRAFLTMVRSKLPNPDSILLDPENAPIPDRPDLLWAVSTALAKRATDTNRGRVFRYAERLFASGHGEFAVLMVKDINRLQPSVRETPDWTRLVLTDLGKSFLS